MLEFCGDQMNIRQNRGGAMIISLYINLLEEKIWFMSKKDKQL